MSNANTPQKSAIEQRINELVQHSRTLELYLNEVMEREATVTKLIEEARLASYALQNISLDKENEALYSFENICDTLGFHPDHIRKGLMAWKDARLKMSSLQAHPASPPHKNAVV